MNKPTRKNDIHTMTPAELIAYTDFKSFGDWEAEQSCYIRHGERTADDLAALVVPHIYTPNVSTLLEDSNWGSLQAALAEADPSGEDYDVHYMGHWATDYELITVRPGSEAHRAAELAIAALADYPVLDEEDFSRREEEQQHADIADGLASLTVYDIDGDEIDTDNPLTVEGAETMDHATRCMYLVHQIWEHMWNDGQPWRCLEETGRDGGGGVDRDDVERALEEMGYERIEDGHGEWIAIGGVRRAG